MRGSPSAPRAEGGRVGFDDAARALAVDDAHHDGARLRAGEFGDDRNPEPADAERHRRPGTGLTRRGGRRRPAGADSTSRCVNEYG